MMALLEFHPIESPPFQARLWLIFWLPTPNSLLPHNSNFPLQLLLYLHPRTKISRHNHIISISYSWSWRSSLASLRSFIQFPLFELFWNRASKSNRTKSKHVKLELTWNPCSDQRIENGTLWYMGRVRVRKQGPCKSGGSLWSKLIGNLIKTRHWTPCTLSEELIVCCCPFIFLLLFPKLNLDWVFKI